MGTINPQIRPLMFLLSRDAPNVSAGTFFRYEDGQSTSSSPIVAPFASTLVSVTAATIDASAGAWGVEVLKNDVQAVLLTGAISVLKIFNTATNVAFAQGDEIKVRTDPAGNTVSRPNCILVFRSA